MLDALFRRYDATYDVNVQNAISGAIQRRVEVLLPLIVIAPFGSMLNVDVTK